MHTFANKAHFEHDMPLTPRIFVDSTHNYVVLGVRCRTGEYVQLPLNSRAWRPSNWMQYTSLVRDCKVLSR